jgi:hypothetical protein
MDADAIRKHDHRVKSASATFQKGVYHLFRLHRERAHDHFGRILRAYQCVFELCRALLLLDFAHTLDPRDAQKRLRQRYCKDPKNPTLDELDPAVIVDHATFEYGRWRGFAVGHPLCSASASALTLHERLVYARHTMVYRPRLIVLGTGPTWEDCDLLAELGRAPEVDEIEDAYRQFVTGIVAWESEETGSGTRTAAYFLQCLFLPYEDRDGARPTETLFSTYARAMDDDERMLQDALAYRNGIVSPDMVRDLGISLLSDWRPGDV